MGTGGFRATGQCGAGQRGRGALTAGLVVLVTLSLSACGTERASKGATGGTTTNGTRTAPSPSVGSPYVEPGAGDGAPHYRENNGFRISGDMSAASAKDARREADRIEPVLKRLWQQRTWDPKSVRVAMLKLGYREERFDAKGNLLGGTLRVEPMDSRFENGREVRPEGAQVGLRVHDDACVTAFVQKTNYQVSTNGPYPETGCFEPPAGH
ncbi:hypothetical protein ABT173_30195 [Streptomyces sp. NPDC001795]|uniref:hypothetical protein n=1 Tax=Streptomyces sp. NPDC001795 TaxID=3154525 RepID=UPI003330544B